MGNCGCRMPEVKGLTGTCAFSTTIDMLHILAFHGVIPACQLPDWL
jgi:hypothetical protein